MKESSVVLEELEAEELSEEFPQRLPGGITERHVKEWNIEDKRIGIEELMSLLAKSKSN